MKWLLLFISSSTLLTTPTLPLSTTNLITLYSTIRGAPFYPNVNINPGVNLEVYKGTNSWWKTLSDNKNKEYIFDYLSYTKDKQTFLKYYKSITLDFGALSSSSGFNRSQDYNGPVTINLQSSDFTYTFFNWSQKGAQNQASNNATVDITWLYNKLYFNFKVNCWMYQGGNSSWTDTTSKLQVSKIILNSNQNLNAIKNNLTNALSNTINLVSDYSGSLIDKRNIIDPTGKGNDETTLLNSAISKVLSNEYNDWKQYIQPFSFSDDTRKATTTIKFNDPVTSQQQVWTFNTPINITLSQNYWGKSLNERMHLLPGQIVNPDDSTKGMIIDTPDILDPPDPSKNYGGTLRYHTTASIEFDSLLNNTEWLEINGTKIDVLDNKFSATLLDNRVSGEKNNTYDIIAYHKDDKYKAQYEIKVVIETLVPDLKLKWYAWDPDKNPEQNILITPNLPDGKPNPKYDKEINADTGTKTQIIWVKNKSLVPFALDPLDKNGNVIDPNKNPEEYDLGFIAEGAVAGKGVNQTFNDSNILSVYRQGVQNTLEPFNNPNDRQKNTQITSDSDTQYWSDSGIWHYIENLSDKSSAQKFMIIGADYSNQYPRFLDILNNSNIAVDFWTTIHGVHLKNYLATYKGFDSAKIGDLSYEQVAAYWKEYTSDVISQRIPPDPTPANYTDITGNIPIIKMNETDLDAIVSNILVDVDKYITSKSPNAKIKSDYNIYSPDGKDITIDNSGLSSLLQDQINPQYLGLIVKSSSTSTLLIGTARVQVRNSSTYDPTNVRDLSKIKFENYKYNFADFTPEQLRTWIYKDVDNYMNTYGYNDITLNEDYGISGNRIPDEDPITHHNTPGDLNDLLLKDFLDNSTGVKTLTIIVYADDASDKTTGYSYQTLINDPNAKPVPPDPPIPPDPNPKPDNNFVKRNLWWIITLVVGLLAIGGIIISIILIRRKKSLGKSKTKRKGAKVVKLNT